jgi:hypothetical protein
MTTVRVFVDVATVGVAFETAAIKKTRCGPCPIPAYSSLGGISWFD